MDHLRGARLGMARLGAPRVKDDRAVGDQPVLRRPKREEASSEASILRRDLVVSRVSARRGGRVRKRPRSTPPEKRICPEAVVLMKKCFGDCRAIGELATRRLI